MKLDSVLAVQIHLRGSALMRAKLAMVKRLGIRKAFGYTGPRFSTIEGSGKLLEVAVGQATVNVVLNEDVEYVYPLHSVGRIKITG
jgi:hypothetical protein